MAGTPVVDISSGFQGDAVSQQLSLQLCFQLTRPRSSLLNPMEMLKVRVVGFRHSNIYETNWVMLNKTT